MVANLSKTAIKPAKFGWSFLSLLRNWRQPKIKAAELAVFTRTFASMFKAGLPIMQIFHSLSRQMKSPAFKKILIVIKNDIASGMPLAQAMAQHPGAFDNLFISMISAGEAGGVIETVLTRLAIHLEKDSEIRRRVGSALMYPAAVVAAGALVVTVLSVAVVPTFEAIFKSLGVELPLPTRILIGFSAFVGQHAVALMLAVAGIITVARQALKNQKFRMIADKLKLSLPIFGFLITKSATARVSRTLATLLRAGVPILDALETVSGTAGNLAVERAVLTGRAAVREGKSMSVALERSGIFPEMFIQMASSGEESGKLDEMLSTCADFFESEVDAVVSGISSLIEPLVIVALGIAVGFIALALFVPLLSIPGAIGQ